MRYSIFNRPRFGVQTIGPTPAGTNKLALKKKSSKKGKPPETVCQPLTSTEAVCQPSTSEASAFQLQKRETKKTPATVTQPSTSKASAPRLQVKKTKKTPATVCLPSTSKAPAPQLHRKKSKKRKAERFISSLGVKEVGYI